MADGPLIALVAGEASGDNLGAALIAAIRQRLPAARFVGIPGPRMREAGCEALASSDELALMGLAEILRHLPRLLRLRRGLLAELRRRRPAVFVGIDAPEFNLGVARRLKADGIPTVQYVSPQVWAWRQGRVRGIAAACDRILCLLPFEPPFYARHGVSARFVGHPLADQFPLEADRAGARAALGLADDEEVVAILPGSRLGEVSRLAEPFIGAAAWLAARRPRTRFIAPLTNAATRTCFEAALATAAAAGRGARVQVVEGQSRRVLAAADVVLVASGTATLETLLTRRPMVVAYRLAPLTAFLLRRLRLVKVNHFAQPNLLVGREVVPEFFQEAATPAALGAALLRWLEQPESCAQLRVAFEDVHRDLRRGGADLAAAAVLELLGERADEVTDAGAGNGAGSTRGA
ncbi:MAG: lipid-A-disaccharide synthase [Gammaproteobacteria bacterium]|nr:lipid-A-disaccharide synthase [Gammaproteobacteria bacterium]